jgi:hypothetical protein
MYLLPHSNVWEYERLHLFVVALNKFFNPLSHRNLSSLYGQAHVS